MGYLQFDKDQLINLEYSLNREILRSNRSGSYASTTIIGCNTRKYHGLLICPCYKQNQEKYVLLSTLDVSVIQHDQEFNLGIHKYQGDLYIPRGHKYVRNFDTETTAVTTFRVGGVILEEESLLLMNKEQILIKIKLIEAHSDTLIRFRPFLAFRRIHDLAKTNLFANTKYEIIKNGIRSKLYDDLPGLSMQFNKQVEFIPTPDWYYNVEYLEEQKRGYDFKEDLFVPGYFECPIKKGETIIFSASTSESKSPSSFGTIYTKEKKNRTPRNSYFNCLKVAAEQFIDRTEEKTEIIAGFPWFGAWGRDTFIALPGLTLTTGNIGIAREVIDTMVNRMKGGLFPNMGDFQNPAFNSVDAPLWFFHALQQYEKYEKNAEIWKTYHDPICQILNAYRNGTSYNIRMLENGLIWAGEEGKALTWMDAVISSGPVTPRMGMPVEINGLWYNAVCVSLEWAEKAGDKKFIKEWKNIPQLIKKSFIEVFWDEQKGYLADYVNGDQKDYSVRPNQVISAALDYTPLDKEQIRTILLVIEQELLTPKGLRTLTPKNENYSGVYEGNQEQRDYTYHQGTVWPWLLEFYVKAYLKVHKKAGLSVAKQIFHGFEEDMTVAGIGTISEIYDGDPPHNPKGAISQAWSVAALLRIYEMILDLEQELLHIQ